jgi:hypothetical protein
MGERLSVVVAHDNLFFAQITVQIAGDVVAVLIAIAGINFVAIATVAQKFSNGARRAAVAVPVLAGKQDVGILNHAS